MAVEYITSKNMADLTYETIRLMNKTIAHHCMRVSYIMGKMLETRETYEKYEIADFMMLALLHDIGAFKTVLVVLLEYDKYRINAKSIMGIIAFNPSEGMNVTISANGNDEGEAVEALEKFFICE